MSGAFWPWLVAAGLAACHNDAGALYADQPLSDSGAGSTQSMPDSGAAPTRPPTPYESALGIYGDETTCLACVEDKCEGHARTCAEDDACREDAACRTGCGGNPECEWDCKLAQSKLERPTYPLEDCIVQSCVDACRVGQNFDCVGEFGRALPGLDADTVTTWHFTLGFSGEPIPEGIRARVCRIDDLDCAEPLSESLSDAEGVLRVVWPKPSMRFGSVLPFEGYLELTDPDHDPPRVLPSLYVAGLSPRNNPPTWPYELVVNTPNLISLLESLQGLTYDAAAGVVLGVVYDCRASERVRGVCVTFEVSPAQPDTRYFYGIDRTATCSVADPMASGGTAHPVPPGFASFIAFHDGREVARLSPIPVRAGAATFVTTVPE